MSSSSFSLDSMWPCSTYCLCSFSLILLRVILSLTLVLRNSDWSISSSIESPLDRVMCLDWISFSNSIMVSIEKSLKCFWERRFAFSKTSSACQWSPFPYRIYEKSMYSLILKFSFFSLLNSLRTIINCSNRCFFRFEYAALLRPPNFFFNIISSAIDALSSRSNNLIYSESLAS